VSLEGELLWGGTAGPLDLGMGGGGVITNVEAQVVGVGNC